MKPFPIIKLDNHIEMGFPRAHSGCAVGATAAGISVSRKQASVLLAPTATATAETLFL